MARGKSTPLRAALSRMFPKKMLERSAQEAAVVRRRRRVEIVSLFWVLLLTLDTRGKRTLADLRRSYETVTGTRLSSSSFQKRFSPYFARWLRHLVGEKLEAVAKRSGGTQPVWGQIREVLCIDSTVVRLHDALARAFPACRTNHTQAAAKLHTVLNVRGKGPQSIRLTSERVHDGPVLRAGRWVRGRLLLFDLGYFSYRLFANLGREGGFFLTRLKEHANPAIVELHRTHRGRAVPAAGRGLQEFKDQLQREVFDAEAELSFHRRPYAGRRTGARLRVRIVGLRDDVHGGHHWYVTNLPPELVPAEEIGRLYSARWAIELLFREMKSCYQLESIPSRKRAAVEAFLYAAVLTLFASHALRAAVRRWAHLENRRLPLERWGRLVVSAAPELLAIILDAPVMARLREKHLLPFFAAEAPDPNSHRPLLLERAGLACVA
jgi:putative transposase